MIETFWEYLVAPYRTYPTTDILLEVLAFCLGLASVWYSRLENILVFPTGIISTGIYVYLLHKAGLFGDMSINAYYFAMSIYGWYYWSRPQEDAAVIPITAASRKENLVGLGILLLSFGVLVFVLSTYTSSTVPYIDGFTTAIFFVAMWFMAKKKIENWIYWIIGDIITVPLYIYKGLGITSLQYLIFTVLAIMGYVEWRRRLRAMQELSHFGH